jgi:pyrroloquinoline quinone biosynthesis protein B
MKIRVLGSAAGGGAPQWNCGCDNCVAIRRGAPNIRARTQESVAVSADGNSWVLLNASPEIRAQIESFPGLHPRAPRHTPIAGVVLTNGDLDHSLGLLSLRESQPLQLYATERVRAGFTSDNVLYRTLERFHGQVTWHTLTSARELTLLDNAGVPTGLTIEARPVPGKAALHLSHWAPHAEDNVGLLIRDRASGTSLAYVPGVAGLSTDLRSLVEGASVVFFDGTFWSSDELPQLSPGSRRAEDMAHWPVGGQHGSLQFLRTLEGSRRVLIHLNNTNPLLREDSPEVAQVREAGVEVAFDGMEISS